MRRNLPSGLLTVTLMLISQLLFSQVGINTDGSQPDPSAILDIKATDRGMLIPRISESARNLIPSPANGLLIYNSTTNSLNCFTGTWWSELTKTPVTDIVGDLQTGGGVSVSMIPEFIPDPSAILEISDPAKGVLLPRTYQEQILLPSPGLIIYNMATNTLDYYNGNSWMTLCSNSLGVSSNGGTQNSTGLAINEDGTAPHHSAVLDVNSNNKGILIPRLTNLQRDQILPSMGLIIYNTTDQAIQYFDGIFWNAINTTILASVMIEANLNPVCSGTTVTFTATPTHGGTAPIYQWKVNGISNGGNTPVFNYIPADNQVITCEMTSNAPCINGNPVISNAIEMTVNSSHLSSPMAGIHYASDIQVIWNWNQVAGASGYRWNAADDYGSAMDNGTSVTFTESGLTCNTLYQRYVWAYNACGTSTPVILGQSTTACSFSCGQPITDARDGKTYNTVSIGSQCWMAQNLNTGNLITVTLDQSNNDTIEKYCYNDLEYSCDVYGGLYQWNEMMGYLTIPGARGICPEGWHLPATTEWATLTTFLGGEDVAGGPMKETGFDHWLFPNSSATNLSGFTGIPGGYTSFDNFYNLGTFASIWSSTPIGSFAYMQSLSNTSDDAFSDINFKSNGLSVRCVSDIDCPLPASPVEGVHVSTVNQIIWNWNPVADATGYKWNSADDYTSATDLGTELSYTETGLNCNTSYTRYIWAVNACGHSGSTELDQPTSVCMNIPCPEISSLVYGGQTYHTVLIGTQCWLKENLNIGQMIDGNEDQTDNGIMEKYCYDNLESNCDIYGGLFQWAEVVQYLNGATNFTSWDPSPTGNVTGICPPGWHIPSDTEWTDLSTFLGGNSVSGGKLKETGSTHWHNNNIATNESGFTALGGGYSYPNGDYSYIYTYTHFWSSSEDAGSSVWGWHLFYESSEIYRTSDQKNFGRSVRCLRD